MGVAVLLAVYGGALGNWFNSIAAAGTQHSSIGASTAVFALLGAIAGSEAVTQLQRSARTHWLRRVAIPTIGSLAMLALYGGGDPAGPDRTDVGAHLFGWLAGMICGFAAGWLPERILRQPLLQGACSGSALLAVYVAWRAAMLHSS
jgi:membrane associated rhomboid family serine protease